MATAVYEFLTLLNLHSNESALLAVDFDIDFCRVDAIKSLRFGDNACISQ